MNLLLGFVLLFGFANALNIVPVDINSTDYKNISYPTYVFPRNATSISLKSSNTPAIIEGLLIVVLLVALFILLVKYIKLKDAYAKMRANYNYLQLHPPPRIYSDK